MVAIDIAAVLAIHDLRLDFLDDGVERCDQVGEWHGVEPLIGEAERPNVTDAQRLRRALDVIRLTDALAPVSQRFTLAHDHGGDVIALLGVQGDGAAAAQDFIIGMRGDHQHTARCLRRHATPRVERTAPASVPNRLPFHRCELSARPCSTVPVSSSTSSRITAPVPQATSWPHADGDGLATAPSTWPGNALDTRPRSTRAASQMRHCRPSRSLKAPG